MADGRPLSILLVEDDDSNLALMAKLLRFHGFTVHTAPTAQDAVSIAVATRCDLVVCDLGLPDRTGTELMRELKTMYGLRGVALTGHTGPEVLREVQEAGFERHFAKPVEFNELIAAVKSLVGAAD